MRRGSITALRKHWNARSRPGLRVPAPRARETCDPRLTATAYPSRVRRSPPSGSRSRPMAPSSLRSPPTATQTHQPSAPAGERATNPTRCPPPQNLVRLEFLSPVLGERCAFLCEHIELELDLLERARGQVAVEQIAVACVQVHVERAVAVDVEPGRALDAER